MTSRRFTELLMEKYPDENWDRFYLLKGKHALQKRLERAVATLFPVNILSLSLSLFCG